MEETEEKTATPSEPQKITLPKKEKNPGRVAAGKRLAEWNRQNKLKKVEAAAQMQVQVPMDSPNWYNNCYLVIGVLGVSLTALGLYWSRSRIHRCPPRVPEKTPVVAAEATQPAKPPEAASAMYDME